MNPELPKTITNLLAGIDSTDDANKTWVLAATFNLYTETMRRIHHRVLLGPNDIRCILDMAYTMIVKPPQPEQTFFPKARERELSQEEAESILDVKPEREVRRA